MVDRLLTINIRKYLSRQPRTKRQRKAVRYIRERVAHYTKINEENVRLSQELNNLIFKVYSRKMIPVKLKVKIGTDTADVIPFKEGTAAETKQVSASEKKEKKPLISLGKKSEKTEQKQEKKEQAADAKAKPAPQQTPQAPQQKPAK